MCYRASLKRGLAFSYSFKNPPLSKMGHVNSQSQHADAGPSTSQGSKVTRYHTISIGIAYLRFVLTTYKYSNK